MIPILQFDPATLTLWYHTQLLASSRSSREVGLALHYAIDGQEDWLRCLVRQQHDTWTETRCASVASAVWHEKRHFLDFALTNYGALRVRQFFQLYINALSFLQRTQQNGPVLVPLDRNLDPHRCEMMNVEINDPDLKAIAEWIEKSKRMTLDDRRPFSSRFGEIEIGGEAILECIAYHVQLGKTHRVFGKDIARRVQFDNFSREKVSLKYQWVYVIMQESGLMDADLVREGEFLVKDEPLLPLLYGALAGRYHGQKQTRSEVISSFHPGERLASLVFHLGDRASEFAQLSTVDAWEWVNGVYSTIFGRSAVEEIDADYDQEAGLMERYRQIGLDDAIVRAYEDYHELRGRFIRILKDDPEQILGQAKWSDEMVNRTHAFVVAAAPAGVIGTPPAGFSRLSGYEHEDTDYDAVPDARWWWTAMRDEGDLDEAEPLLRLRDQATWCQIVADYAPMAKLLIDGNRMRSMVGPEINSAKIRIERQTGVSLVVDAMSRHPAEEMDITQWYYLTGRDRFRCQVTHRIVEAPYGRMLGPWEMRRRPAFREALLSYLKGGMQQRMLFAIWRDWSPWLVCDEIGEIFDAARVEPFALS